MCDLFALSARQHYTAATSLPLFAVRGRQNVHGWGIGFFRRRFPVVEKSGEQVFADGRLHVSFQRLARVVNSPIILAHIRYKSSGEVDECHAHPFVLYFWGQAWIFAHNGKAPAIESYVSSHTIRFARETLNQGLIMLGVRRPMGPVERVVVALQQAMSMEDVRKSDVISVQLSTTSPDMGVAVLQKYLDLFQEKHIAAYRSPRNREFFAAEADRSLQQLHDTEARLARFKDENKVWSITEQSSLLLKTQRELIDQHARTLRETAELQNRMAELRRQEASLPPDVKLSRVTTHDPVNDEMRKQRALVEAQMAQSAVVFGEASPQMIQLRRQLDTVNAGIAARQSSRGDQETTGINQQLYDVRRDIAAGETQLTGLQARAANETTQLAEIEKNVRQLEATETTLYDMQREIGRLDREYQLYTAKLEDSRISDAMDMAKISNVRVISPPTAGPIPVFPPLLMMLAGGIVVGLGGSLAFVFFRDTMHPVVRTRRDIEQLLGVPVLASLPEHRTLR